MAYNISATRVGVNPEEVDKYGYIKEKIQILPPATAETLGGVKVGQRLTVAEDGTLSADEQSYTLPVAGAETLGGVKIGQGVSVAEDGTISVSAAGGDIAIIQYDEATQTFNKTSAEILAIINAAKPVIIDISNSTYDTHHVYPIGTYYEQSTNRYYFIGLNSKVTERYMYTKLVISIDVADTAPVKRLLQENDITVYVPDYNTSITYDATNDTWSNKPVYVSPYLIMQGQRQYYVTVSDGNTSKVYRFMPDWISGTGDNNITGELTLGDIKFDIAYSNGIWTLTKQTV